MQQFAAAQDARTIKLAAICLRFQTEERILSVNKSEITRENAFHGDLLEIEDNHEGIKDTKTLFLAFLQIWYSYFNPQTVEYVYLCFSSIVRVLQFLSHFLQILGARSELTQFQTNFLVNRAKFLES